MAPLLVPTTKTCSATSTTCDCVDTSKENQVQIGQGEVEYGRLVTLLAKHKYRRALCVDVREQEDIDDETHMGELRKIRLLLESLL